jgi:hypothetical protein
MFQRLTYFLGLGAVLAAGPEIQVHPKNHAVFRNLAHGPGNGCKNGLSRGLGRR